MKIQIYVGPPGGTLVEKIKELLGKQAELLDDRFDTVEIVDGNDEDIATLRSHGWMLSRM